MVDKGFLFSYAFRDLWRQRSRTILGIIGVSVSIFLLTTVLFLTDAVSAAFVGYLTTNAGGQDMNLTVRHYNGEPTGRTNNFDFQNITEQIEANVSQIAAFIPRITFDAYTNGSATSPLNKSGWYPLCAMNVGYENNISFGQFNDLAKGVSLASGIPVNCCIISQNLQSQYNISNGDKIKLYINQLSAWVNLTVISSFTEILKFPTGDEKAIIVDISWWGNTANQIDQSNSGMNWTGKADELIMTLQNAASMYDIRNIQGSELTITGIGAQILTTLGVQAWNMDYPKLDSLGLSSFLNAGTQVMFLFISFIAMIISGILINSILTTSVEERIREYGVNRVLGARRIYNVQLILIQGALLAALGTSLGIIEASLAVKYVILPIVNSYIPNDILVGKIQYVVQPTSVLISYAMGIGVSLFVSIFPALRVMRMKIVDAINPYRHEESVFKLERDSSPNSKMIVFGAILAANGLFVYVLMPQVLLSMDFTLMAGILLATLLIFLMGVSLLAIGLMPLFLRFFLWIFGPFAKRIINVMKITIYRYQRRNMSTTVIFILSFSFMIFVTSMISILQAQVAGLIQFDNGSDIVVYPVAYNLNCPTVAFQQQIMQVPGVERTSALMAQSVELQEIYAQNATSFSATIGDYINFNTDPIRLYGVDQNYPDVIYDQQFMQFTEGDRVDSFSQVFEPNATNIIISTALSNAINLNVGDQARLVFTRGSETQNVVALVVGVASDMPGLPHFKSDAADAEDGGVIISQANYAKYFDIPSGDNAFSGRIFVQVKPGYDSNAVANQISSDFSSKYEITVVSTESKVSSQSSTFTTVQYVFLLILIGTVLIGLFGLISSAYASVVERKREIAIIRTLGLHGSDVNKMFFLENLIFLIASGGSGTFIGYILGSLLSNTMTMFTETPSAVAVPWNIIGIVFSVAIVTLILGMRSMLRNLKKQKLIEIYRATE